MKIVPNSRRHRYMAGVGIFLVTIALIVGMISWPFAPSYNLTIASTAEGSVTTPGEGTFTYYEGTVVILIAKAEEGYRFVEWTGDVDTIADVYDALSSQRVYKEVWDESEVLANIKAGAGHHFDPELVKIFLACLNVLRSIQKRYQDRQIEE